MNWNRFVMFMAISLPLNDIIATVDICILQIQITFYPMLWVWEYLASVHSAHWIEFQFCILFIFFFRLAVGLVTIVLSQRLVHNELWNCNCFYDNDIIFKLLIEKGIILIVFNDFVFSVE